jgi:hypothetical protein
MWFSLMPAVSANSSEKKWGRLPVPAGFPRGAYRLGLRFADPSERLRDDGRYAIRLANQDIDFAADGGWNILVDDIACE